MKSFLGKNKIPIIKWGLLPNNTFFEGKIPEGYNLFVVPVEYIIVDVDVDNRTGKNGFNYITPLILTELEGTYNYTTKRSGKHYWFKYTGDKILMNKASKYSIDLRVGDKGYVVYYPDNDIRDQIHLIKETSLIMNRFLEDLFS